MSKIVIVSGFQIISNPRVAKEADALSKAGHTVEVLGAIWDKEGARKIEALRVGALWHYTPMVDLAGGGWLARWHWLVARLHVKLAQGVRRWLGWEHPAQLGYFTGRLLKIARSRQADLYIVHLEPALWVGVKLLQAGFRVAVDVEDWYSEDLLPADRSRRPVAMMRHYEATLLQQGAYATTTSHALSQALANAYQVSPPVVVYNTFPWAERASLKGHYRARKRLDLCSLVWFSQTIGPGRGLEQLMQALHFLQTPVEIHVRGNPRPGFEQQLRRLAPEAMQEHIYFHGLVPQAELLACLAEHDMGFCGELSDSASRDLTLTNKAMEYLRAGLAVIASDTQGQMELAKALPDTVFIYAQRDPQALADKVNLLVDQPQRLQQAKQAALQAAQQRFCWERDAEKIVTCVQCALAERGVTSCS
ncbi:glycosyl transferase, group 1 [Magnetococcus marinus MC-1]|uniref:Glycosyl transferase, group 1 n=1 Tax=Magnetococcus marinus (strain ATCC BAA-1437 / JCM 17883 / MC-1) TaxID=156889 RepID=A0LAD6_MAGMM|nr:glycosyltransferase [Magnetococcus marinus]ABK44929.1 glycosyl transferase, group 1 [Magnetococcus marinus MC-1]